MARENLTDRRLAALKAAPKGSRYDVMDSIVPGMGVRVTDKGQKTFILVARFPGSANPTRRALGEYGVLELADARAKARVWHELIRKGIDPKEQEADQRAQERRRRDNSFGAVVEDYIRLAVIGPDATKPLQRKGPSVARELRDEFVNDKVVAGAKRPGLGKRPIDSITPHDIVRVTDDAVARGAEYQAHNLLGHVRTMFNWAIARGVYGLEKSPCDRMRPNQVIGKKALRTRVLTDDETFALWRAAGRLGYPFGPFIKLLLLTGQRRNEVSDARWRELDLEKRLWTIPAERMKADAPHVVPLSAETIAVLKALPRFKKGDHLFSTTFGAKPVSGFSKAKARLDRRMLRTLRALARRRGAGVDVELPGFVFHDIRRTMRTGLSGLPVSGDVAELVIAHARPGLRRVYDQFAYVDEKRRALDLWTGTVRDVVAPPPANVVKIGARA
jgi:integrase